MSAQVLALLSLLNLAVPASPAESGSPAALQLVVYLKVGGTQPAGTIQWMKHELGPLLGGTGYRIQWSDLQTARRASADALVVVELSGSCEVPAGAFSVEPPEGVNSLASTSVSEGRVLPFATVNCSNLTRALSQALAGEAAARRDFLYGRAMARVLAHELYHILAGTQEHTREGISKAAFTAGDLLAEPFDSWTGR